MSPKIKILFIIILTIAFSSIFFIFFRNNIMYSEYVKIGGSDSIVELSSQTQIFKQSFTVPYEMLEGIKIKIRTFNRKNDSEWLFKLVDDTTGKEIYNWTELGKGFVNNDFHYFSLPTPFKTQQGQSFTIYISSTNVDDLSSLAFFTANETGYDELAYGGLFINDVELDKTLAMRIVGGDRSVRYWLTITIILGLTLGLTLFRINYLHNKNLPILRDVIIQSVFVAIFSLLLLLPFLSTKYFIDENDIFHSGFAIANGKILYKEYVSQHPPVTMFLSGLFAILGAGSLTTFRLFFYVSLAITFGVLFYRHKENIGSFRLSLFFLFAITVVFPLFNTWMMGDVVAAIGNLMILLEFIQYVQDKKITILRSIFISIGVFISFGSTFLSVFSIAWIVLMFVGYELEYWLGRKRIAKEIFSRYYVFILIVAVPFLMTMGYFQLNLALKELIRQVYFFNRQVYSYYIGGFGSSVSKSIINSINNFLSFFTKPVLAFIDGSFSQFNAFSIFVGGLFLIALIQTMMKKRYLFAVSLLGYIVFLVVRGTEGIHGVAFALSIAAIGLLLPVIPQFKVRWPKTVIQLVIAMGLIFLLRDYYYRLQSIGNDRPTIDSGFYNVILSELDGDGDYYIDFYSLDELYLEFKVGAPVNRTPYMLAWYMDWYLPWSLEDLDQVSVVIFNPNISVWGHEYSDYNQQFITKLTTEFFHPLEHVDYLWLRNSDVSEIP